VVNLINYSLITALHVVTSAGFHVRNALFTSVVTVSHWSKSVGFRLVWGKTAVLVGFDFDFLPVL